MSRKIAWASLALILTSPFASAGAEPVCGEVVLTTNFDGPDALGAWKKSDRGSGELTSGYRQSESLRVECSPENRAGGPMFALKLPLEKLRGARVKVEAMIKAENVAQPPHPWNGVKCMLHTRSPAGPKWQQRNGLCGTFDWRPVHFTAEVPLDASDALLILGLEQTSGAAWFDDVKVTVVALRRRPVATPAATISDKGHGFPRLRGTMIGPRLTADDLRELAGKWNANHIRWQLIWGGFPHSPADRGDLPAYDAWLESALGHLDQMLPLCKELGVKVLIDLHTPPGGRDQSSQCRMFHQQRFQDAFLAVWDKIARRYRDNDAVWGYDLVNEPVEGVLGEGLMDWRTLAIVTAERVRAIDRRHAIIVEPAPWGSPGSLDWFEPLDVPGVVYSVHMYLPHSFTHQGVHGSPVGVSYPGQIDGRHVDKRQLRQALQPVIDYQRDYGVPIYIGEFSAIRWAPGDSACNYLRDVIDIFEENGWDWAYHAFREWDGWSVEHGPDPKDHTRSSTQTDRQRLLQSWFAKNLKPSDAKSPAAASPSGG